VTESVSAQPQAAGIQGLAHLLIQVSDLEAAERFYCGLLGLRIRQRTTFGGDRPLLLTYQGVGITLLPSHPPKAAPVELRNVEHIAFWVTGVAQLAEALTSHGFKVDGPRSNDYGLALNVFDPDGYRIECIERS
jgi:catechol 2,3-dioxygenase-like lactoylglutathione lyase family enzyme